MWLRWPPLLGMCLALDDVGLDTLVSTLQAELRLSHSVSKSQRLWQSARHYKLALSHDLTAAEGGLTTVYGRSSKATAWDTGFASCWGSKGGIGLCVYISRGLTRMVIRVHKGCTFRGLVNCATELLQTQNCALVLRSVGTGGVSKHCHAKACSCRNGRDIRSTCGRIPLFLGVIESLVGAILYGM